jgi:hypothetical protein
MVAQQNHEGIPLGRCGAAEYRSLNLRSAVRAYLFSGVGTKATAVRDGRCVRESGDCFMIFPKDMRCGRVDNDNEPRHDIS